jgi:hypothetical protein
MSSTHYFEVFKINESIKTFMKEPIPLFFRWRERKIKGMGAEKGGIIKFRFVISIKQL